MSAARVGEQSAVEWKLVYRKPFLATRSRAGVGMTPPNVLVTPNPESSVMISSTFGAPFFGITFAGQKGLESTAMRSILPPNLGGGGGIWFPGMVVVALGDPGTPVVSMPLAGASDLSCWPPRSDVILLVAAK